ncbi:MAG TPA: hypothetical protein PK205_12230 [Promineifilum sp.]|nr:hypothetical protein [Promineifilum sp.]
MSIRVILSLLIIGGGIAIMYLLQPVYGGLAAALIGSLFFLFALALWTLPAASFQRGTFMDPIQRRVVGAFLGIGLGMFGGLAVAALIPRPFNWIVLGVVAVAVTAWYYRK